MFQYSAGLHNYDFYARFASFWHTLDRPQHSIMWKNYVVLSHLIRVALFFICHHDKMVP